MSEHESDGFLDFGMGVDDDGVGKKAKTFKAKDNTAYRVSFCWFSVRKMSDETGKPYWDDAAAWDDDGNLVEEAVVRFAGCRRVYVKGVGQILYKGQAYQQFGKPKDCIATILCVWPTDDEGDLDATKFKAGKGWLVQPWIHGDGEKYQNLKKINKRFPLMSRDVLFSCPENGGEFQKITFTPEDANLLRKLLASDKPEARAIADKIVAESKALAREMNNEMARDLTVDEIREKQSGESSSPKGGGGGSSDHATKDVDALLDGMV